MKTCTKCLSSKPLLEFSLRSDNNKHRHYCRVCENAQSWAKKKLTRVVSEEQRKKNNAASKRSQQRKRNDPSKVPEIIYEDSRKSDRKKGFDNDLTVDFIREIIKDGCIHCGETNIRMTVDRIDNSIGHLQSNVEGTCYRCNILRRDMPHDAFLHIAPKIREAREMGLFGAWIGGTRKLIF